MAVEAQTVTMYFENRKLIMVAPLPSPGGGNLPGMKFLGHLDQQELDTKKKQGYTPMEQAPMVKQNSPLCVCYHTPIGWICFGDCN